MIFRHAIVYSLVLVSVVTSCSTSRGGNRDPYVIMVSFDGFRWDYTDLYETPNFDRMAEAGVKAEKMIPSFPTKTFPNHYTLVTGLYPDHHGIINNTFFAPDLDALYRIGNRDMVEDPDFYFGEPIWVTAEKQGLKTASFFWVGSEAPIGGMHPTYWKEYDGSIPFKARVDTVIHWLKLPAGERPRLITLYFDEPDGVGHDFGPEHPETGRVIRELDGILGYLQQELAKLDIAGQVNLIVTSDHGMGPISPDRYVNLDDYIRPEWVVSIVGSNPFYLVDAEDGFADSVSAALKRVRGVVAWQKEEIPARLHYGTSIRFPDLAVLADSGWSTDTRGDASRYTGGTHGYDNAYSAMHTIFFAEGPGFKQGYRQPPFPNVDVYSLIARLLYLDPASNDGNPEQVSGMLNE